MYNFIVKSVSWNSYRQQLSNLRHEVFVKEQNVPIELELDEYDSDAFHVAAFSENSNEIVGTGRLLVDGKIGRMAVKRELRRCGIGKAILRNLLKEAVNRKHSEVILGAQLSAIDFYKNLGFKEFGDIFIDAGIDHRMMRLNL